MARYAKKMCFSIKHSRPRVQLFFLALLLYIVAFCYRKSLTIRQGSISKRDGLERHRLITQAVKYFAALVIFILLLIFFKTDFDQERQPIIQAKNKGADIYETTILWGVWLVSFVQRSLFFSAGRRMQFQALYGFRNSVWFRRCWAHMVDFGLHPTLFFLLCFILTCMLAA